MGCLACGCPRWSCAPLGRVSATGWHDRDDRHSLITAVGWRTVGERVGYRACLSYPQVLKTRSRPVSRSIRLEVGGPPWEGTSALACRLSGLRRSGGLRRGSGLQSSRLVVPGWLVPGCGFLLRSDLASVVTASDRNGAGKTERLRLRWGWAWSASGFGPCWLRPLSWPCCYEPGALLGGGSVGWAAWAVRLPLASFGPGLLGPLALVLVK